MPIVLRDKVKVRTRTAGLASYVLEDAIPGFRGFEAVGDGNQTYYSVADSAGNFEIGLGTYSQGTSTLTRETVLTSSNNNQKINFPAGSKTASVTFPAELANAEAYQISAQPVAGGAALRFSDGSNNIVDDVNFLGSVGIVIARTDDSNISITTDISQSVALVGPNPVLRLSRVGTADDDITVTGTGGIVTSRTNANTLNIDADISQSVELAGSAVVLRMAKAGTANDDITVTGTNGIVTSRINANTLNINADISQSVELAGSAVVLRMAKAGAADDDITVTGTNGTTISRTDANTINIDTSIAQGLSVVFGM